MEHNNEQTCKSNHGCHKMVFSIAMVVIAIAVVKMAFFHGDCRHMKYDMMDKMHDEGIIILEEGSEVQIAN